MLTRLALVIMLMLIASEISYSQARAETTHGTINVYLESGSGAVLVTDSRITGTRFQEDHSQKLFSLDRKTICSVADFYWDSGPITEERITTQMFPGGYLPLFTSISALIQSYAAGHKDEEPFDNKVAGLTETVRYSLKALDAEKRAASGPQMPTSPQQLIVAGYDADHSLRAVKASVHPRFQQGTSERDYTFQDEVTLVPPSLKGNGFKFLLAGWTVFAQRRLDHPENYWFEPELTTYREAIATDRAGKLSVVDLESLGRYLMDKTVSELGLEGNPVVGGEAQLAVLRDGDASLSPQRVPFQQLPKTLTSNVVSYENTNSPLLMMEPSTHQTAFLNTTCRAPGGFLLDGGIFLGGTFDHCLLYFNGHSFYLDPNNVIIKASTLVVGPFSNDQALDFAVQSLPTDIELKCWKDLPIDKNLQLIALWRVGSGGDLISALWHAWEYQPIGTKSVWAPAPKAALRSEEIRAVEARCAN